MFMLIVLIVSFLLFRGLGLLGLPVFATWQDCASYALAIVLLLGASARLNSRREDLIKMVPKWFPYPRLVVDFTGICEVLGAIGLMIPFTRSAAGFCLAVMFVAIFPANVKAALEQIPLGGKPPTPLWLRLPMQLLFIGFALWAALLR
jgi:uncharacterized membrane protein